jgi:peptidoglycan/xylan/chitin deacetylase (PgdA/CDA1 family)
MTADADTPGRGESVRARVPYEAIGARGNLRLPGNARVAVWTIVNVENWSPQAPMPRTVLPPPMGQPLLPDVPNWAWHEYGMRVGFWRLLNAISSRGMRATFAVNGSACSVYRAACEAARGAGWEFMGHGYIQSPMHRVNERAAIAETIAAIADFTGHAPRGWESPGLTETDETIDLLAEAGIEYVADWVLDEQPVRIQTKNARGIVSIPYTVELNDVVISAVQQQPSDEILRRGRDQFDRLYLEGAENARVMAISVHPYLTGVAHRIKYLEALYDYIRGHEGVVMWTGSEILDWYRAEIEAAAG